MSGLDGLLDRIERAAVGRPVVVGITGAVAVGKSTFAGQLEDALLARGRTVATICTDCFLLPNEELNRRGIAMRKGFPESYDDDGLLASIAQLKAGEAADLPVYSHATYDIVAGERDRIEPSEVLVLEGVNVLQEPVAGIVDVGVFIAAEEPHVRAWFVGRFHALCDDGSGMYERFAGVPREQRQAIAEAAWTGINLVNFTDHIAPSRARAAVVVEKDADHTIRQVLVYE